MAFRTLRYYEKTSVRATVGNNVTSRTLAEDRRLIVAQGTTEGIHYYSPAGAMTYNELGLLDMPGDSLALLALLPARRVSLGDKWTPRSWAVQMLTGTEVAEKAEMTCRLESVAKKQARVNFTGTVVGAKHGAGTRVTITGHFLYNLQRGYIQRLEMTQQEQSAAGPISPAMNVRATVIMDRKVTADAGPLKTSLVSRIPLEPSEPLMRIRLDTPWRLRFHHSRQWHLHHQSRERATLQLLDRGNLVAQVNIKSLPSAAKGEHLSDIDFQKNIRTTLGRKLKSIVKAELLKTKDKRYLYRVVVAGEMEKVPMQWIFYLCASPSGRQVMLEFTVEKKLLKQLQNRDVRFVTGLDFLEP
ncbi:MAG: hypothetical protein IID45_12065 [Planctomycetes bacterium]|nr:hypothetical protein [Planctomycetota bacterium]